MKRNPFSAISSHQGLIRHGLIVLCISLLGGCAWMPDLESQAEIRPIEQYESEESLKGDNPDWPEDKWWVAYGDAQLDQLIEEGLTNSPNMTIAAARLRRAISMAQLAGSALYPDVDANASVSLEKQSYR